MASSSNGLSQVQSVLDEALQNELILQLILQQLPIGELKTCRLVCSKWNRLAMREIQTKNWNHRTDFHNHESDKQNHFKGYMNVFRNSPENLPYSCYKFSPYLSTEPCPIDSELLREFCVTFKKQIKGIHFSRPVKSSLEILEICGEFLVEIGISTGSRLGSPPPPTKLEFNESSENKILFPNLKCISVDASYLSENDVTEDILSENDIIFKNILSNMRPMALEELNYHSFGRFDSTVKHLIEFNQIHNLRRLSLYPRIYGQKDNLLLLTQEGINLQLKQLRIHNTNPPTRLDSFMRHLRGAVAVSEIDPEHLYQLLNTQKKFLEDLNVICSKYSFPSNMMRVQNLKIGILKEGLDLNTRTISFAESFPNLNTLSLSVFTMECDWDEEILSEQEPCMSLQELTMPRLPKLSGGVITRTLRIFPKLSSLELYAFSHDVFLAIWNSVELADSLNVLVLWITGRVKGGPVYKENCLNLDHIFSGVSEPEILGVNAEKYSEEFSLNEFQNNSILKLKNLRKLYVYWVENKECKLHLLTDFAVVCVFDKMENLKDLFIHQNIHRFSHACVARLRTDDVPNSSSQQLPHDRYEEDKRPSDDYLRTRMSTSERHWYQRIDEYV